MVTLSSAPGKVILLGEHAAVYGNPVLVASIDKRSFVKVTLRNDGRYVLNNPAVDVKDFKFSYGDIPKLKKEWNLALSLESIEKTQGFLGKQCGLELDIQSDIPVSSGLGSSASISSAMVLGIAGEMGHVLGKNEIAKIAWDVENVIHKKSSGVDPFSVTYGGVVRYQEGKVKRLNIKEYPAITIGNTNVRSDTGEVVLDVMKLKNEFPVFFGEYLKMMDDLVEEGIKLLEVGDLIKFGRLMDINHGLLCAIGVSSPELEELVWAARKKSLGAKLCGAGRGGIMVALGDVGEVGKEIAAAGGDVVETRFAQEGVRIEPIL